MKENKTKTSVYLPESLFWRFKEEVVRRRFASDTAAMEAAIRQWIDEQPRQSASHVSSEHTGVHQLLEQLLKSGDEAAVTAAQKYLQGLATGEGSRTEEIHLQSRRGDKRRS
ncbi:MAG: hypothetical protein ABI995_01745 [Acidobacteriota bacterium]